MSILKTASENTLYYGDNLEVLKEYIPSNYVDLVYLDPPFNSNRNYNILFRDESGKDSESQITAFEDSWHWNDAAEATYHSLIMDCPERISSMIGAMRQFIGSNQMMAYLVMMGARLVELHRVLKPTGSLYLHCDPTASHYLKIILDTIFEPQNYKNEIIWQRINAKGNVQRKFGAVHDTILVYSKKMGLETWNQIYRTLDPKYVEEMYRYVEEGTGRRYRLSDLTAPMQRASKGQIYEWKGKRPQSSRCWVYAEEKMQELENAGRIVYTKNGYPNFKRYLDENLGEKIPDVWEDIKPALGNETLGYPTQKPLALLERILQASSNPGDIVLDPFCGCGTAIAAAEKTGRKWIGIDITYLSIALQKYRMGAMFPGLKFNEVGIPNDALSAQALAHKDRYQFQYWALPLVNAKPVGGQEGSKQGKKGSDKGIDGIINFEDGPKHDIKRVIVQVKSGHVSSRDIRDLVGTVKREGAAIGVFITLEFPTSEMLKEAVTAGYYQSSHWGKFPAIQILTIEDLLHGAKVKMPFTLLSSTIKQASKVKKVQAEQVSMSL